MAKFCLEMTFRGIEEFEKAVIKYGLGAGKVIKSMNDRRVCFVSVPMAHICFQKQQVR
jgi:hypothetical protein